MKRLVPLVFGLPTSALKIVINPREPAPHAIAERLNINLRADPVDYGKECPSRAHTTKGNQIGGVAPACPWAKPSAWIPLTHSGVIPLKAAKNQAEATATICGRVRKHLALN